MQKVSRIRKVLVNCRIGSLEKPEEPEGSFGRVNCRIGSLENLDNAIAAAGGVNCRIGSLEMHKFLRHVF